MNDSLYNYKRNLITKVFEDINFSIHGTLYDTNLYFQIEIALSLMLHLRDLLILCYIIILQDIILL